MLLLPVWAGAVWNAPHPEEKMAANILFSSFSTPPKHLDPVVSYSSNEWSIISQIYEPPLQYHYLKRPYRLEPLTLEHMPEVLYLDNNHQQVAGDATNIAFTKYVFTLKEGVRFQPHPAFAKEDGRFKYHALTPAQIQNLDSVYDLKDQGSRVLKAQDYVYAIKRMGLRQNQSPILDSMQAYIVGLDRFSQEATKALRESDDKHQFDLRQYEIDGFQALNESTFTITIKGVYPQFLYWLSMNFFAPIPWEAEHFYRQPGLIEKNITLDTTPVGTGPYYLAENNPNQIMRLLKNPNFHTEYYPTSGLPEDADPNLLADAGKRLPFIDEVVYSLEKESVPLWNKFLQGYYDASGVSSDSFDQAVSLSSGGSIELTATMRAKGINFLSQIEPTIYYLGFNMADPVVGGYSEKQKKLRQAISLAVNFEEYISIFMNGRGQVAQGPIPPGIFGHKEGQAGINPILYDWQEGRAQKKSLQTAKKLLAEAGYPQGKKPNGDPLTLYYDTAATGPDSQSQLNWYRKQFAKLGINLVIRATDYNRFQDKVRGAKVQMFSWGWNADYPDPENFLFLLYGGNASIHTDGGGVNSANYDNPEFNRLFEQIKSMKNSEQRQQLIQKMLTLVREDAPWIFGFHPQSLALYHGWMKNVWPNALANNIIKYRKINGAERAQHQAQWNQPVIWPLLVLLTILVVSIWPARLAYKKRQRVSITPQKKIQDTRHSNEEISPQNQIRGKG